MAPSRLQAEAKESGGYGRMRMAVVVVVMGILKAARIHDLAWLCCNAQNEVGGRRGLCGRGCVCLGRCLWLVVVLDVALGKLKWKSCRVVVWEAGTGWSIY